MALNNGPPLMINHGFLEDKRNIYKICQIVVGILCVVVNWYCFPNSRFMECTPSYHSVPQIFTIICVNVFFMLLTSLMGICNLFGITDAFYKFNFQLMEKLFATLALCMYVVSSILVFITIVSSPFIASWAITLICSLLNTFLYGTDACDRWQHEELRYH